MNLARLLDDAAARDAYRTALVEGGEPVSYGALAEATAALAASLQERGAGTGERVALLLPNSDAFVAAYYASLRVGAVVVPLNILLSRNEIEMRLASADVQLVVTDRERAGALEGLDTEVAEVSSPLALGSDAPTRELVERAAPTRR